MASKETLMERVKELEEENRVLRENIKEQLKIQMALEGKVHFLSLELRSVDSNEQNALRRQLGHAMRQVERLEGELVERRLDDEREAELMIDSGKE